MWIYIGIGLIMIFVVYKERQALGCPTIPNGSDCDNINGKAVKGTKPSPSDSDSVLLDKIRLAASYKERFVYWRKALILAFVASFVFFFVAYQTYPTEYELVVCMFVFAVLVIFGNSFYIFHLCNHVRKNIESSVDILESRQHSVQNESYAL